LRNGRGGGGCGVSGAGLLTGSPYLTSCPPLSLPPVAPCSQSSPRRRRGNSESSAMTAGQPPARSGNKVLPMCECAQHVGLSLLVPVSPPIACACAICRKVVVGSLYTARNFVASVGGEATALIRRPLPRCISRPSGPVNPLRALFLLQLFRMSKLLLLARLQRYARTLTSGNSLYVALGSHTNTHYFGYGFVVQRSKSR
jgi:hypothetical protein